MIKDTFEYGHLSQKYTVPIQPLNFINSINLKFDETSYKLELNMGTVTYINANANLAKFKDAISRVNESFLSLIDTHLASRKNLIVYLTANNAEKTISKRLNYKTNGKPDRSTFLL
jgi:hypothetical protein